MLDGDFLAYLQGRQSFQPYAAGKRKYGFTGRSAPNIGPVGDKTGYISRDLEASAKRNAILARLKASKDKKFMSSAYLNPQGRGY